MKLVVPNKKSGAPSLPAWDPHDLWSSPDSLFVVKELFFNGGNAEVDLEGGFFIKLSHSHQLFYSLKLPHGKGS